METTIMGYIGIIVGSYVGILLYNGKGNGNYYLVKEMLLAKARP